MKCIDQIVTNHVITNLNRIKKMILNQVLRIGLTTNRK